MKRTLHVTLSVITTTIAAFAGTASPVRADEIKTVLSKVVSIGSQRHNASAREVNLRGVGMIAIVTGDQFKPSAKGQLELAGQVSQIAFVLPARPAYFSTLQSLCLERLAALQSGANGHQALELTFEGSRIGSQSYVATKLLGCADVANTATKPTPSPVQPPKPTPKK